MDDQLKKDLALAETLLRSGNLPSHFKNPEQVLLVIMAGRELRVHPIHALKSFYVIDGTLAMRAELMLSLIIERYPKARIEFPERTKQQAVVQVEHRGCIHKFCWTWEMAIDANLLHKKCWKQYPIAMLTWRCVADMARLVFPDVLNGISYTPEELGEETDEDGYPLNAPKSKDQPRLIEIESVDLISDIETHDEEPSFVSEEKEKLTKLLHVLTSESVGFTVVEVEKSFGSSFENWGAHERVELENAVRRLKKSNTPEQNKQVISLFLGESL